ncbi:MAG TPA: hypothetical protein VGZ69_04045 [Candidatus Rhabdochlamydia sp.]|jgi:hypothetical protein|nr:hypothetical protein [Candidatus Rhabdochlamydia sp.]
MPVQNLSIPITVTLPVDTYNMMLRGVDELIERAEIAEENLDVKEQRIKILETANTVLKNDNTKLKSEKTEEKRLIQLIDEDLQLSKTTLQWSYAIVGAILGGGLVLVCPVAGTAIALAGTGPAAAGAALAGGAAGGCIVAPVVHKKMHKASIQQVQNFKAKEEVSKKAE